MQMNGEGLYFLWGELGVDFENGVAFAFGCQDFEPHGVMISPDVLGVLAE
jgi:hypothetical protein